MTFFLLLRIIEEKYPTTTNQYENRNTGKLTIVVEIERNDAFFNLIILKKMERLVGDRMR